MPSFLTDPGGRLASDPPAGSVGAAPERAGADPHGCEHRRSSSGEDCPGERRDGAPLPLPAPRLRLRRDAQSSMWPFFKQVALSLFLMVLKASTICAVIPCNSTHNRCEELLFRGSRCKNGYCTNPFAGGCLKSMLQEEQYAEKYAGGSVEDMLRRRALSDQHRRICNSEDSESSPFCQPATDGSFSEVRILAQNWASAIATTWIMQIILSEILDVPATTETGGAGENTNFYNEENRMDYGSSSHANDAASVQNAFDARGGECTIYESENDKVGKEGYKSCAHVIPQLWTVDDLLSENKKKGVAEEPSFMGALGIEGWYITKFSIDRDPSLGLYTGYQGTKNRQKLVETFKRPTTWGEYCTLISEDNCSTKDEVAGRAPANDEDGKYFVEGSYRGYFSANNCTADDCTGHFMDYPCGWVSYFTQQAFHLDVALKSKGGELSDGYTNAEMVEIWKAANATKSDLIGQWYRPEATFSLFQGTDSELIKVTLPSATEACEAARVPINLRCDGNATLSEKIGAKEGACDEKPNVLKKVVVGNLKSNIEESKSPKAAMSPAYDFIEGFLINELQLDRLLNSWSSRGIDPDNFDLRFAMCKWMADNLDYITTLVPLTHPRAFLEPSRQSSPTRIFALVISTLAVAVAVAAAFLVSEIPKWQSISTKAASIRKNSQIEFLYLLLAGVFLVSMGALLMACMPSKGTCITWVWLVNIGYTLAFVPTLVRVSAIIKVLNAAKKFRRVQVDRNTLVKLSLGISTIAALFCALWTGLDPMTVQEELSVADETNDLGETLVRVSYYCQSEFGAWTWVSFVWQSLLLVSLSALAYQMRSAPAIVNDSAQLAFMTYSSFMFLFLRIVVYVWASTLSQGSLTRSSLQMVQSIFWSIDSMMIVCIYFFSKLFPYVETRNQPSGWQAQHPGEAEEEKTEESDEAEPICHRCGEKLGTDASRKAP